MELVSYMPVLTGKLGKDIEGIIKECKNQFPEQDTITIRLQKEDNSTRLYIQGQGQKLLKQADGTNKFIKVTNDESLDALSELIEGLRLAGYSSVATSYGKQGY